MDVRLHIPKNWQDFESICHRLWSEIWSDMNAQKNGRQGQPQCGVDVFGRPIYAHHFQGVQCKDKDGRLGSSLKIKEIDKECNNALRFKPELSAFTMATTAAREEAIQEYSRELTAAGKFPFAVNVWSWDDIESEIIYRPSIMNHFYAGYSIGDMNLPNVKLTRYSSRDHFHAFFSRPGLTEVMSPHFKSYFQPVVYELMDNSYKYGKAKQFEIKIGKDQIQLIDNGIAFNPIKGLDASKASSESHIGSFVLESFLDIFKDVTLSYERKDDENILEFNFKEGSLLVEDGNLFEMTVDLKDAYGRENAKHLAEKIPTDVNEIVLNVTNIFNISVFVEFTKTALERMEEDQKLTMFLPRHAYLSQFKSWFADERLIIHTR